MSDEAPVMTPAQESILARCHRIGVAELQARVWRGEEDDRLAEVIDAYDAYFAVCRARLGHDQVPVATWETYAAFKRRHRELAETTVSLSHLRDARTRMTMPGAMYASDEGRVYVVDDGVSFTIASVRSPTRAQGIVATHNAADALLEIAEAAKGWQRAVRERLEFGEDAYRDNPFDILSPEFKAEAASLDGIVEDRLRVLKAALTKVSP